MSDENTCDDLTTDLSPDDAYLILEPYFVAMREKYCAEGLDRCSVTQLYVAPWIHDQPRHFAACEDTGKKIIVSPEMAELPEPIVVAIFGHELGHATDFLYPGEFVLGHDDAPAQRRLRENTNDDAQWERWMRAWQKRDDDVVEFTADAIAHLICGERVGYVGPCLLQCFSLGEMRPIGLR